MAGGAEVRLTDVRKRFAHDRISGDGPALDGVSLVAAPSELVVVVGPSGCGKSTLLRIVAGLETPDAGEVHLGGRSMAGVAPQDREVAMVFQSYALYPHMTARQILEFPLKMRRVPKAERVRAVARVAALLRIETLLDRTPGRMSGGERQRVAMGRALVREPRVFLFDEPLSNLDAALRSDLRLEIGQIVRRLGATALYVTHDHVEAMTLADRIAVLNTGRLLQLGTPREVYETPATSFVATFVGSPRMNLVPARALGDAIVGGPFRTHVPAVRALPDKIALGVRPEHVALRWGDRVAGAVPNAVARDNGTAGEVVAVEPLGAETHVVVRVGGEDVRAVVRGFDAPPRGARVAVSADPARVHVFDAAGEGRRVS